MRTILHPGPAAPQRVDALPVTLCRHDFVLEPGRTLLEAVAHALGSHSAVTDPRSPSPGANAVPRVEAVAAPCKPGSYATVAALAASGASPTQASDAPTHSASAVLRLSGGALFPFAHVMPALSTSDEHAVYFSARFDAVAPVALEAACITFGTQGGRPWLHCHARWTDADGSVRCGHVLPRDALIHAPITATAWVLAGAGFDVVPDAETRFSLFKPHPVSSAPADGPQAGAKTASETVASNANANANSNAASASPRPTAGALAVRLAPNVDVCTALELLCCEHGWRDATVHGGVGSTVGAVFDDGRRIEPHVTELLIRAGRVRPGADGAPVADIDVSLVDHTGGIAQGRLARGANPVLVTFELVLERTPDTACT